MSLNVCDNCGFSWTQGRYDCTMRHQTCAACNVDNCYGADLTIKIKKLTKDAVIPKYAKPGDAGMDLVATSVTRKDGYIEYGTGLAIEIPQGYVGKIYPRSSISKYPLALCNSVGIIDSGYRGELKLRFKMINSGVAYNPGDRVAQLIIEKNLLIALEEVKDLSETTRGVGGFGHSGI